MIKNFNIPSELFTTFNDAVYYDEPHKYFIDDKELISVTTLIHKYQEGFNETYWSEKKGCDFGVEPKDVLIGWDFINRKGTFKGSLIHDYAENLFLNKRFKYPLDSIISEFGFDPITNEYDITKKHVDKFHRDVKNKLIPIRTEMIVYDRQSLIGGMVDMLFYNVRMNEFQLWDYKTNKKFVKEKPSKRLLYDLHLLDDCDYEIYSLQLQLYKYIIEKNTSIKLGKSYIIWFSHNNPTYEIFETKDRAYFVNVMVNDRIKSLNQNE